MSFLPIAILSINLCGFLFDLIFLSNKTTRNRFFKLPVFLQKLFPFVIVGPVFIAPLIPQNRFNISGYISLPTGILLFVLGWTILLKSIISIVYFPLLFLLYFLATVVEERILIEQYGGQYIDYKKKVTKRFIPFIV